MNSSCSRKGFTLLELTIAMVVLTIAGIVFWYFIQQSQRSWETIADDTAMMQALRRAEQDIHLHLIQCNPTTLEITNGVTWDCVSFQIPISLTSGVAIWGADNNASWEYIYEVRNIDGVDSLIRATYNDSGVEITNASELILHDIAPLALGNRGLSFVLENNGSITSTIGSRKKITGQNTGFLERSLRFNTLLRNGGSAGP